MLARRTATTDLIGSLAEYLSAPGRGMAGDAHGAGAAGVGEAAGVMAVGVVAGVMDTAGMDEAAGADTDTLALAVTPEGAATPARDADSLAADTTAVVASTVVAVSTAEVEVASTAEAVDTVVADTGNPRRFVVLDRR